MAAYSFKKEAKVYVVYGTDQYNIDISEINFTQTLMEKSTPLKTIHTSSYFEKSIINKANPANFEITFPAIREDDFKVLFDRALDYQTFDLYVETEQDVFKIETCVITNGRFIIERLKPLSMAITGEASKVSRHGDAGTTFDPTASEVPRDNNMTYNRISDLSITLGGTETLSNDLASVSVELRNEIKWTPFNTIDGACDSTSATLQYPSSFSVTGRSLGGAFRRYLTDTNNTNLLGYDLDVSLRILAGQDISGTVYGFDIDITNCMYANRVNTGTVFTQVYDWRMVQNPADLSSIISYVTL